VTFVLKWPLDKEIVSVFGRRHCAATAAAAAADDDDELLVLEQTVHFLNDLKSMDSPRNIRLISHMSLICKSTF
jgi:hypothetical protein